DLERDAGAHALESLLAAATEDEGIAALQAHDPLSGAGAIEEDRRDLLLRQAHTAPVLAREDDLRIGARVGQQRGVREIVVDHDVAALEAAAAADGQEPRVAGTGTDEAHAPDGGARAAHSPPTVRRARAIMPAAPRPRSVRARRSPSAAASPMSPAIASHSIALPSSSATSARRVSCAPATVACAASGVWQSPP